jgi:hypothetical protein
MDIQLAYLIGGLLIGAVIIYLALKKKEPADPVI